MMTEMKMLPDNLPPQAVEAEQAVLGAMLVSRTAAEQALETLTADDFHMSSHGAVFAAIERLSECGVADVLTVPDELGRRGQLDAIGGVRYVNQLIEAVPTAVHVAHYAQIVVDRARRRRLMAAAEEAISLCGDLEMPFETIEEQVQERIYGAARRRREGQWHEGRTVAQEVLMELNGPAVAGIPSGLGALDRITGGWRANDLVLVGANPGVGKTALICGWLLAAAKAGYAVGLFSVEMDRRQIMRRLVAIETGINGQALACGKLSSDDLARASSALGFLGDLPIYIDDATDVGTAALRTRARRLHRRHGVALIGLDYVQRIMPPRASDNAHSHFTRVAEELKNVARECGVTCIALSQFNREAAKRADQRPRLHDLRESSGLEAAADLVILPYRPAYAKLQEGRAQSPPVDASLLADPTELIVPKHRNGPLGVAHVAFWSACLRFADVDTRHSEADAPPDRTDARAGHD